MGDEDLVRLNVEIPRDLWKRAKMFAVEHDSDLRTLVIAALTEVIPPDRGSFRQVSAAFAKRLKKGGKDVKASR